MLFLKGKKEGYLLVDHSASPGLTETQARQAGYDPTLVREGKRFEAGTMTCCHCKTTVVKNLFRTRERASCSKCGGHYLCDLCEANSRLPEYTHLPYEKLVDMTMDGKQPIMLRMPQLGSPPQLILPPTPPKE